MLMFLFILFFFFLTVSLIIRILFAVFVNRTKRRYANATQQESYRGNGYSGKKEGEVYVSSTKTEKDKVVEKDMGEYIDFETVKED